MHPHTEELPVLVAGEFRPRDVIPAVGIGEKRLAALRGPFHRPAHLLRGPGDRSLFGVVRNFRTESTAHVRRYDAQLMFGNPEHKGAHQQPDDMGILAGGVQRVAVSGRIVFAYRGPWLDGVGALAVVYQVQLGDVIRPRKCSVRRIGIADAP